MIEYGSVSAPSYAIDDFVAKLNAKSADGWDVVSIASAGADLVGILKREASSVTSAASVAPAESVASSYISAPAADPVVIPAAVEPVAEVVNYIPEVAPVEVAPEPVVVAPSVAEPVGWASAPAEPVVVAPQPAPQPAPVVTTPAGWYPDPSTRFEMRYWDGTAWTEHVSRQGQQYTDPPVA
jgi:Protein of unknown function (DUF2510)